MPSATVNARPRISCVRLFFSSPQCAHVTVTPEDSSRNVFSAGIPQAPIGVNISPTPGPAVGHCTEKSGHRSLCSRSPSHGTDSTRM